MHKYSSSFRDASLEATLKKVASLKAKVGITRVSDITGLDRIGIPVFQAIRPASTYPVTVFAGKGTTAAEARLGAMMEATEAYVAERYQPPKVFGTAAEIAAAGYRPYPLDAWGLPSHQNLATLSGPWVPVQAIHDEGEQWWVPAELVCMPCPDRRWAATTNGIASGNSVAEALLHGLFEVIERDALSLALVTRRSTAVADAHLAAPAAAALLAQIARAGLTLVVHDITGDLGFPTFYAVLFDADDPTPWMINVGSGTHLDPHIALCRAITEAAQSRAGFIAGAREDLAEAQPAVPLPPAAHALLTAHWKTAPIRPGNFYPAPRGGSMAATLRDVVDALRRQEYLPLFANLSHTDIPFAVVRVLVPKLECFAIDKSRVGARLMEAEPLLQRLWRNEE